MVGSSGIAGGIGCSGVEGHLLDETPVEEV